MRLDGLVFVTSNLAKLREAEAVLGHALEHHALDIPEIQSLDLGEVVRHKAAEAYRRLGRPVLVEDTSLELAGLAGFPGPLVRWVLATVGAAGISTLAQSFGDRRASARCIACATDGVEEILGLGEVQGTIADTVRGRRGFGWDVVFIPTTGDGRTFAEMEEAEKNAISHRRQAFEALRAALAATG